MFLNLYYSGMPKEQKIKQKDTYNWLSVHLFYAEPFEPLLTNAVKPFVDELVKTKQIRMYFFIRYWEKGPHIRLRLEIKGALNSSRIKTRITKYFNNYFKHHPSERSEPVWVKELGEERAWHPNNSVRFIPYIPETERYGGPLGIKISHKQFYFSSKAVLSLIAQNPDSFTEGYLKHALLLHLTSIHPAFCGREQTLKIIELFYQTWLPSSFYLLPDKDKLSKRESVKQVNVLFNTAFKNNRQSIKKLLAELSKGINDKRKFEEAWLNTWIKESRTVYEMLRKAAVTGKLIYNEVPDMDKSSKSRIVAYKLRLIYNSFIHMSNNRIGVKNQSEAYVAYLLQNGLP